MPSYLAVFLILFSSLSLPAMTEGEWMPSLYSKVVLIDGENPTKLFGSDVILEIDQAYTIGKSIAVVLDENIIGHLDKSGSYAQIPS